MHIEAKDFDRLREACIGNAGAIKILDAITEADRLRGMKFERVTVTRAFSSGPHIEDCERLDAHWCIAQRWDFRGPVRGKYELLHIAKGLGVGSIGKRVDIVHMHEKMKALNVDWTDVDTMSKSPDFQAFREICREHQA